MGPCETGHSAYLMRSMPSLLVLLVHNKTDLFHFSLSLSLSFHTVLLSDCNQSIFIRMALSSQPKLVLFILFFFKKNRKEHSCINEKSRLFVTKHYFCVDKFSSKNSFYWMAGHNTTESLIFSKGDLYEILNAEAFRPSSQVPTCPPVLSFFL